jgi:hypothetical protein
LNVGDPLPEKLQQPLVMHRVEEAASVGLYEEVDTFLLESASQSVKAPVRTMLGAVAVATLFEPRLEEWFEYPLGGEFHDLVLEAADPQRASRLTARLGNVYPTLGLGTVAHAFEAGGELLEVRLQSCCVHRLGHLIHAHGFMAFELLITCP